jgi:hypothetical protein
LRRHLLPRRQPPRNRQCNPPKTTSVTAAGVMARAEENHVLTVGVSPAPMAGVVAVTAGVAEVAGPEANAPDPASASAWTPTANRPPTTT